MNQKHQKTIFINIRTRVGLTKGTPFNTAGWTSVEVAGKIIERIGPILATKYLENYSFMIIGNFIKENRIKI